MPRLLRGAIPTGNYPAGTKARIWPSRADGVLIDKDAKLEAECVRLSHEIRWGESAWGTTPWGQLTTYTGWGGSTWGTQGWAVEYQLFELPAGYYEEGTFPMGFSVKDRYAAETTTPPATASVYINDSPSKIKAAAVSVAADEVTMTVAFDDLLSPISSGWSSGFDEGFD